MTEIEDKYKQLGEELGRISKVKSTEHLHLITLESEKTGAYFNLFNFFNENRADLPKIMQEYIIEWAKEQYEKLEEIEAQREKFFSINSEYKSTLDEYDIYRDLYAEEQADSIKNRHYLGDDAEIKRIKEGLEQHFKRIAEENDKLFVERTAILNMTKGELESYARESPDGKAKGIVARIFAAVSKS